MKVTSTLYENYKKDIQPKLQKELGIKNVMNVPKIEKICINVGMGSYLQQLGKKDFSFVENNITNIAGQKPVIKRAKLSVSNFKLREGQAVGISATLRGVEAYNFLDKLINIVYPRVRDFRGVSKKTYDNEGNFTFGFNDHTVFPEGVQPEDARQVHGLQITIVTSTKEPKHSKALLDALNFPFKK